MFLCLFSSEKQVSDSAAMKQDIRSSFRRFRTNSFIEEKMRASESNGKATNTQADIPAGNEKHSDRNNHSSSGENIKHSLLGRTKSNDEDCASGRNKRKITFNLDF